MKKKLLAITFEFVCAVLAGWILGDDSFLGGNWAVEDAFEFNVGASWNVFELRICMILIPSKSWELLLERAALYFRKLL